MVLACVDSQTKNWIAIVGFERWNVKMIFSSQFSVFNSPDILGGYCGGVPPLPIPNREVKPACADGTAMQCGRVGGRLLY